MARRRLDAGPKLGKSAALKAQVEKLRRQGKKVLEVKPPRFGPVDNYADDPTPHIPKVKALPEMPQKQREALPDWPALDPNEVAKERARLAEEGNRKLSLACDALRECLQDIQQAEMDLATKQPVSAAQLRGLALEGLQEYSRITGTPWKRNRVIKTRAARSVEFRDLSSDSLKREGYE